MAGVQAREDFVFREVATVKDQGLVFSGVIRKGRKPGNGDAGQRGANTIWSSRLCSISACSG
jgi:hypothetical protein